MAVRTTKIDNDVEKRIVTGMIVSTQFLRDVRQIYRPDLMAIPYARQVAQWCVDHYERYEQAPGRDIAEIFEGCRRQGMAGDHANLIEDFLAGLSDDYEHAEAGKFNAKFLLDEAERRFEARNQELLVLDIKALHMKGDYQGAADLINGYNRVQGQQAVGCEPLTDMEGWQRAFDDDNSLELFQLPGALGELVGPIVREDFIGILAPEKRGKTWRAMDIAIRGLRAGCNVAYFDAGDMSEDQWKRRLGTRITGQSPKYWGRMLSPVLDCRLSQEDLCRRRERRSRRGCMEDIVVDGVLKRRRLRFEDASGYQPCTECHKDRPKEFFGAVWYEEIETERLDWRQAYEAGKRFAERSRKRLKLSCHANSTLTVAGMRAQLDRWRREDGFVADLVIADYFDIFAPEDNKTNEERLIHDRRWKAGRRLTQELHCALVTPTQADAPSYDQRSLRLKNFSESKTKYAHVTKFLALNQTDDEKRDGVMRIATLIAREEDFDVKREVVVGQNLRLGQPYVFSYFDRQLKR